MPDHERVAYSAEQADAIWVGERPKLNSTITLVEYDSEWPRLFDREAERIRGILGDVVLVLEHVGSTSVPGLCAKPIIDILLVVPDSSDEGRYLPQLEAAGYRLVIREPDREQHRVLKGPDTDINLHVYSPRSVEIERYRVFRGRLRAHPEELELYSKAKRKLAGRTWTYIQDYADAKNDVIDGIVARARA